MAVTPACHIKQALRPVSVAATRVAILEKVSRNTTVLARRELLETVELDDIVSFGQIELGSKRAGVLDLIDVELDGTGHGPQIARIVAQMVPRGPIVEGTDLVGFASADHDMPIVELVLLGRVELHRSAGLSPWTTQLLRRHCALCGDRQ